MRTLILIVLLSLSLLSPVIVVADDQPTTGTVSVSTEAQPADPVWDFLRKVEERNSQTTALEADFEQVRVDTGLLETVASKGKFHYQSPDKFRADYESENSSTIWMLDGQLITYVPNLEQVEMVELPTGEEAPIHQLLLGFGVKVSEIRKLFDVSLAGRDTAKGTIALKFESKDLSRTMEYASITITFDEAKVEPLKLVLEDEQTQVTVDLKNVRLNPTIDPAIFATSWPDDAQVIRYKGR